MRLFTLFLAYRLRNPMIDGLQGDFGDLDIKCLKQNIPKYLKMSVGNIRKLQENTAVVHV